MGCVPWAWQDGRPYRGLARATGGYPEPVSNPDSNFIFLGLSIRLINRRVGVPQRVLPAIQTKKDPNGFSRRGTKPTCRGSQGGMGLFPGGSYPHLTGVFRKSQAQNYPIYIKLPIDTYFVLTNSYLTAILCVWGEIYLAHTDNLPIDLTKRVM